MNKIVQLLLPLAIVTFIAGCTLPYGTPSIRAEHGSNPDVQGVKGLLKAQEGADRQVDIIAVHGMCTHNRAWAVQTLDALTEQLGGKRGSVVSTVSVAGSNAMLYKRSVTLPEGTVHLTAVVWSPILRPLKEQLCYDMSHKGGMCSDDGSPRYEETRALVNRLAKDTLLNDCLADALAYQGKARPQISQQMQEALLAAALPDNVRLSMAEIREKAASRSVPLVLLSESLGSKIAFDAVDALANSPVQADRLAARNTFLRMRQIVMAANQIPILQLSDQTLDEAVGAPRGMAFTAQGSAADPLARLFDKFYKDARASFSPQGVSLTNGAPLVIALTDPNDLLSYGLRNSPKRPDYVVLDVTVSNARSWFWLFENPYKAHTGYLQQPAVVRLIIEGTGPR